VKNGLDIHLSAFQKSANAPLSRGLHHGIKQGPCRRRAAPQHSARTHFSIPTCKEVEQQYKHRPHRDGRRERRPSFINALQQTGEISRNRSDNSDQD
jgi:hypothetical protein